MLRYLKNLLQLTLSPAHGWEDIQAEGAPLDALIRQGYFPLVVLTGVTEFCRLLFHHHVSILATSIQMLITMFVLSVSYFFGTFTLSLFLEPMLEGRFDERRCQTFTLYTLGLVALNMLLLNCLPVTSMMLFFLPLYVALIQWKGVRYMRVRPDRQGAFMILAAFGVLAPPYLLSFLFSLIFQ